MTDLLLARLGGRSWAIQEVHLTEGYWVLLVPDQSVANEVARQVTGLDMGIRGCSRLNGNRLQSTPAARAACASVLVVETGVVASTVRGAFERLERARIVTPDWQSTLTNFGLQGLGERSFESLSNSERRQTAFAMAIARNAVEFFVCCEPRLDLNVTQISTLQAHMTERAKQSCVLCITSSLHDARLLGGPHAQLTRSGWAWFGAAIGTEQPARVFVEGMGLRSVGAELALDRDVSQLVLQQRDTTSEVLQLCAQSGSSIAMRVARAARQNRANVFRLQIEEQMSGDISAPVPISHSLASNVTAVSGSDQHCNLVRILLTRQAEILWRTLRSPRGVLLLLGAPLVTTMFAAGQRGLDRAQACLNALDFVVTYIVPVWSLLVFRVLNQDFALRDMYESLARFGVSRKRMLCANWALIILVSAAVASASALLAVLRTTGAGGSDLWISAWIAAVGATTYVAVFAMLAVYARRAWSQWAFLIANILLGGTALGLSSVFPHGHLLNLIGAPGVVDLAQRTSFAFLEVLIVLAFGLTWLRTET